MSRRFSTIIVIVLCAILAVTTMSVARAKTVLHRQDEVTADASAAFTYQGQLFSADKPYSGVCDFTFSLLDDSLAGSQVGTTKEVTSVSVTNGLFTVILDFGASAFDGSGRWLSMDVRCPAGTGSYVAMTPRQPITPTPYALYSSATPWSGLTGIPAGFADGVDDSGSTYTAGIGLALTGTQFNVVTSTIQARIGDTCPAGSSIRAVAANGAVTCQIDNDTTYTAGTGLNLTGSQFSVIGAPWSGLTGVPAGFADGIDNFITYTAGTGLSLSGTQFSVTGAPWSGLTGVPAGFADSTDNDTTYTAGTGLSLSGTQFSVNTSSIQWRITGTCPAGSSIRVVGADGTVTCQTDNNTTYTAGTGLSLSGTQFSVTGAPWSGLTGVPAGFSDGTDNDTTYTAGTGLSLSGTQFSVTGAPWSGLTGVPAGFSDGTDNDTTYTAGDGLELSGTQFQGKGSAYQNVVIVAKSGGDYTSIQSALNSITDASTTNRYLIFVAPGVYTEQVTMKQYIDIEGSGVNVTTISCTSSIPRTTLANGSLVLGADNAELRWLTVDYGCGQYDNGYSTAYNVAINGGGVRLTHISINMDYSLSAGEPSSRYYVYGVYASGAAQLTDVNVRIKLSGSGGTSGHKAYGIYITAAGVAVKRSQVSVECERCNATGVYNAVSGSSKPQFTDDSITVINTSSPYLPAYAIWNQDGEMVVRQSVLSVTNVSSTASDSVGIYNVWTTGGVKTVIVTDSQIAAQTPISTASNYIMRIASSQLDGGANTGSPIVCAGVYDENFTFYASTCP